MQRILGQCGASLCVDGKGVVIGEVVTVDAVIGGVAIAVVMVVGLSVDEGEAVVSSVTATKSLVSFRIKKYGS